MISCCRVCRTCIVVIAVDKESMVKRNREPFKYNNRNTMVRGFQCNPSPLSLGRL